MPVQWYSDCDLFIVPEFTHSLVENYIKNKNEASGDAYIEKGHKYFNFILDNFWPWWFWTIYL